MDTQQNQDLINRIEEERNSLIESLERLKDIADDDPLFGKWAKSHIIANIRDLLITDHDWLNGSQTLEDWIDKLNE
jgi:hypothetical protein